MVDNTLSRLARWGWIASLSLALLGLIVVGAGIGAYPISHIDILSHLWLRLLGGEVSGQVDRILFEIRFPRIAASAIVGAVLAAAGCAYQGLFRNPLVSPDILGVSTGAGLGAALGILLSLSIVAIQVMAFAGGLVTVALVYAVANMVRHREATLVLVLAGVVIGSLAGATLSLIKVLADPYDQLPAITFWLLGSFASVRIADVVAVIPAVVISLIPMILLRWRMNVLSLGDEEARALGVHPSRLRGILVIAATLMTAAAVSIAGVIRWVGLIVPHMARLLVGPNFARLLPVAMLMGACFLVGIDTLARTLTTTETPIGILTAFFGAPVFLFLLARSRRGWQ